MRLTALASAFLLAAAALAACRSESPAPTNDAHEAAPALSYAPPGQEPPAAQDEQAAPPAHASGPPRSILPPAAGR